MQFTARGLRPLKAALRLFPDRIGDIPFQPSGLPRNIPVRPARGKIIGKTDKTNKASPLYRNNYARSAKQRSAPLGATLC